MEFDSFNLIIKMANNYSHGSREGIRFTFGKFLLLVQKHDCVFVFHFLFTCVHAQHGLHMSGLVAFCGICCRSGGLMLWGLVDRCSAVAFGCVVV